MTSAAITSDSGSTSLFGTSHNLPNEVIQREILPCLDAFDLVRLSSSSRYHRAVIITGADVDSREGGAKGGYGSDGLWQALHRHRWCSGKNSSNSGGGSRNYWYGEYVRRHKLDASVSDKLMCLVRSKARAAHETAYVTDPAWACLLLDGGRDIVDVLKGLIAEGGGGGGREHSSGGGGGAEDGTGQFNTQKEQEERAHGDASQGKAALDDDLDKMARSVLVGINRLGVYREWRRLLLKARVGTLLNSDSRDGTSREGASGNNGPESVNIEDGAMLLAKFYLTSARLLKMETLDSLEEQVEDELDRLAGVLSSCLEERYGGGPQPSYPIPVVLDAMKSFFGSTGPFLGMSDERCFVGNQTNYYDHRNSLLDRILFETRLGIPISLSILYTAIVRRATGIVLDPIGLPGHFVLGTPRPPVDSREGGCERLFIDAFHGGTILNLDQVKEVVGPYGVSWDDSFVAPVPYEEVWLRMIRNLGNCMLQESVAPFSRTDAYTDDDTLAGSRIAGPLQFLHPQGSMVEAMTDEEAVQSLAVCLNTF